ncbi:hypothetical protein OPV22_015146 [Ensete ventricosum]|uniref:Zinc finger DNA-directed DNA polymerase family B alpha domain-containing protein n=1 Tax=Ensete ventricosum TaxID=4639 RepID=A0AAV8R366_ENSVE|nr:hypothetical protein OPV22_015146 [Ensete ventricosum]
MLGNAVFLDGLLFVLGRLPDHLLTFDLDSGEWSVVDVALPPPVFCLHLLVFDGRLFLVGGLEEDVVIARIGIWELDLTKSDKEWRHFCFMPDECFQEFSVNELVHFQTIDRFGIVCFCNTRESVVLMLQVPIKASESVVQDPSSVLSAIIDEEERYRGCEPVRLSCPSCSSTFDCPPVLSLLSTMHKENQSDSQAEDLTGANFWKRMRCPRCPDNIDGCKISSAMLANQVKRQAESFICTYDKGLMMCDDEICKYTTRSLNLRVVGDSERRTVCPNYPQCNGHLIRQ